MNDEARTFPKPVDWDELYPGRFLKASDLKGKIVTLEIASVDIEELEGTKGKQIKGIIKFKNTKTDKALALNKTNGICLKAMFGKLVQEWVGKRVMLHKAEWNGDDCIRVYGSPDLAADLEVEVALPRKRPFNMKMRKAAQ